METNTRSDALAAGRKTYFTGRPCSAGHVVERYAKSGGCSECMRRRSREYRAKRYKADEVWAGAVRAGNNKRKRVRYRSDAEFRERHLRQSVEWQRRDVELNGREKINRRNRERLARDPAARLRARLGAALWHEMKGRKKGRSVTQFLGCSIDELRVHLERQFRDGMTWDNYGEWHIDHILPCAAFDHANDGEVRACWHFTNLRPLWAEENMSKHSRVDDGVIHLSLGINMQEGSR